MYLSQNETCGITLLCFHRFVQQGLKLCLAARLFLNKILNQSHFERNGCEENKR